MTLKRRSGGVAVDLVGRQARRGGVAVDVTTLWRRVGGVAVAVHDWTDEPPPPAGITFVAGAVSNVGFTNINTAPGISTAQAGDVLLAWAAGNSSSDTITPPAGLPWTIIGSTELIGGGRAHLLAATATGALPSTTWTWPGSHNHAVLLAAYRGAALPTTAAMSAFVQNTTTVDAPSVTTVNPGALLVCAGYHASAGTTHGFPASMTPRVDSNTATPGAAIADEPRPTAGATGVRAYTIAPGPTTPFAGSVALEPA